MKNSTCELSTMVAFLLFSVVVLSNLDQVNSIYLGNSRCRQYFGGTCRENCWPQETALITPKDVSYCYRGTCCGNKNAHGVWSAWRWTPCSVSCGQGNQTRTRICKAGFCLGSADPNGPVTRPCERENCPTPWSSWSPWKKCACSTGTQTSTRTRTCYTNGCKKTQTRRRRCQCPPSPWSRWSPWKKCACSTGTQTSTRTRTCYTNGCKRTQTRRRRCQCPPSPWGPWSLCSETCGAGQRFRKRNCFNDPLCKSVETQGCIAYTCPPPSTTHIPTTNTTTPTTTNSPPTTRSSTTTTTSNPTVLPLTRKYCNQQPLSGSGAVVTTACGNSPWAVSIDLTALIDMGENTPLTFITHVCTGALVSPSQLITTRKCGDVIRDPAPNVTWSAIMTAADGRSQSIGIQSLIDSPGGGFTIVSVDSDFPLDECHYPACLPLESQIPAGWKSCRIAGFNADQSNVELTILPTLYKTANVSLLPTSECQKSFPSENLDEMLCVNAKSTGLSICEEDEGWMLICDDMNDLPTMVGLAQTGQTAQCSPDIPGLFKRVQPDLQWIDNLLEIPVSK